MARRGTRDLTKERFWRRMLQRWRRSRLTIRDFCCLQQLSEASFYSWRRILAARDQEATPLTPASPAPLPAFLPVQLLPATTTSAPFEIVLGTGRLVRLGTGFDPDALRQLLAVLEEPSC